MEAPVRARSIASYSSSEWRSLPPLDQTHRYRRASQCPGGRSRSTRTFSHATSRELQSRGTFSVHSSRKHTSVKNPTAAAAAAAARPLRKLRRHRTCPPAICAPVGTTAKHAKAREVNPSRSQGGAPGKRGGSQRRRRRARTTGAPYKRMLIQCSTAANIEYKNAKGGMLREADAEDNIDNVNQQGNLQDAEYGVLRRVAAQLTLAALHANVNSNGASQWISTTHFDKCTVQRGHFASGRFAQHFEWYPDCRSGNNININGLNVSNEICNGVETRVLLFRACTTVRCSLDTFCAFLADPQNVFNYAEQVRFSDNVAVYDDGRIALRHFGYGTAYGEVDVALIDSLRVFDLSPSALARNKSSRTYDLLHSGDESKIANRAVVCAATSVNDPLVSAVAGAVRGNVSLSAFIAYEVANITGEATPTLQVAYLFAGSGDVRVDAICIPNTMFERLTRVRALCETLEKAVLRNSVRVPGPTKRVFFRTSLTSQSVALSAKQKGEGAACLLRDRVRYYEELLDYFKKCCPLRSSQMMTHPRSKGLGGTVVAYSPEPRKPLPSKSLLSNSSLSSASTSAEMTKEEVTLGEDEDDTQLSNKKGKPWMKLAEPHHRGGGCAAGPVLKEEELIDIDACSEIHRIDDVSQQRNPEEYAELLNSSALLKPREHDLSLEEIHIGSRKSKGSSSSSTCENDKEDNNSLAEGLVLRFTHRSVRRLGSEGNRMSPRNMEDKAPIRLSTAKLRPPQLQPNALILPAFAPAPPPSPPLPEKLTKAATAIVSGADERQPCLRVTLLKCRGLPPMSCANNIRDQKPDQLLIYIRTSGGFRGRSKAVAYDNDVVFSDTAGCLFKCPPETLNSDDSFHCGSGDDNSVDPSGTNGTLTITAAVQTSSKLIKLGIAVLYMGHLPRATTRTFILPLVGKAGTDAANARGTIEVALKADGYGLPHDAILTRDQEQDLRRRVRAALASGCVRQLHRSEWYVGHYRTAKASEIDALINQLGGRMAYRRSHTSTEALGTHTQAEQHIVTQAKTTSGHYRNNSANVPKSKGAAAEPAAPVYFRRCVTDVVQKPKLQDDFALALPLSFQPSCNGPYPPPHPHQREVHRPPLCPPVAQRVSRELRLQSKDSSPVSEGVCNFNLVPTTTASSSAVPPSVSVSSQRRAASRPIESGQRHTKQDAADGGTYCSFQRTKSAPIQTLVSRAFPSEARVATFTSSSATRVLVAVSEVCGLCDRDGAPLVECQACCVCVSVYRCGAKSPKDQKGGSATTATGCRSGELVKDREAQVTLPTVGYTNDRATLRTAIQLPIEDPHEDYLVITVYSGNRRCREAIGSCAVSLRHIPSAARGGEAPESGGSDPRVTWGGPQEQELLLVSAAGTGDAAPCGRLRLTCYRLAPLVAGTRGQHREEAQLATIAHAEARRRREAAYRRVSVFLWVHLRDELHLLDLLLDRASAFQQNSVSDSVDYLMRDLVRTSRQEPVCGTVKMHMKHLRFMPTPSTLARRQMDPEVALASSEASAGPLYVVISAGLHRCQVEATDGRRGTTRETIKSSSLSTVTRRTSVSTHTSSHGSRAPFHSVIVFRGVVPALDSLFFAVFEKRTGADVELGRVSLPLSVLDRGCTQMPVRLPLTALAGQRGAYTLGTLELTLTAEGSGFAPATAAGPWRGFDSAWPMRQHLAQLLYSRCSRRLHEVFSLLASNIDKETHLLRALEEKYGPALSSAAPTNLTMRLVALRHTGACSRCYVKAYFGSTVVLRTYEVDCTMIAGEPVPLDSNKFCSTLRVADPDHSVIHLKLGKEHRMNANEVIAVANVSTRAALTASTARNGQGPAPMITWVPLFDARGAGTLVGELGLEFSLDNVVATLPRACSGRQSASSLCSDAKSSGDDGEEMQRKISRDCASLVARYSSSKLDSIHPLLSHYVDPVAAHPSLRRLLAPHPIACTVYLSIDAVGIATGSAFSTSEDLLVCASYASASGHCVWNASLKGDYPVSFHPLDINCIRLDIPVPTSGNNAIAAADPGLDIVVQRRVSSGRLPLDAVSKPKTFAARSHSTGVGAAGSNCEKGISLPFGRSRSLFASYPTHVQGNKHVVEEAPMELGRVRLSLRALLTARLCTLGDPLTVPIVSVSSPSAVAAGVREAGELTLSASLPVGEAVPAWLLIPEEPRRTSHHNSERALRARQLADAFDVGKVRNPVAMLDAHFCTYESPID